MASMPHHLCLKSREVHLNLVYHTGAGGQERNDEIHRPVSDSHYGKLLLEDAHANARFVAGIKKPRTIPRLAYWLALACFRLRLAK